MWEKQANYVESSTSTHEWYKGKDPLVQEEETWLLNHCLFCSTPEKKIHLEGSKKWDRRGYCYKCERIWHLTCQKVDTAQTDPIQI